MDRSAPETGWFSSCCFVSFFLPFTACSSPSSEIRLLWQRPRGCFSMSSDKSRRIMFAIFVGMATAIGVLVGWSLFSVTSGRVPSAAELALYGIGTWAIAGTLYWLLSARATRRQQRRSHPLDERLALVGGIVVTVLSTALLVLVPARAVAARSPLHSLH